MSLDATVPIDGNGITGGVRVNELPSNIRDLKTDINNGLIYTGDSRIWNHVRIAAPSWKIGATGPTADYVGVVPVLKFDTATDDSVHYSIIVTYRIETGSEVEVVVDWCYTGGADAGTVCWGLEYINLEAGNAVAGGTTTTTETSPGSHTSGQMVRTIFSPGIVGAAAHDVIGIRLFRDVSEDNLATDAQLIQVHFEFLCNKLGKLI